MKKFLLLSIAVATASIAMAQWNRNLPKSQVISELKASARKTPVIKSVNTENMVSLKQIKADLNKNQVSKRAGAEDVIKGLSQEIYVINKFQGVTIKNMFSEISYYFTDNKAYLSFFGLDYMEGTIEEGVNRFSTMGADSITFNLGGVAFEKDSVKLVYGAATVTMTRDTIYATRNAKETIGAYYFAETQEIYIPTATFDDFIGVFRVNGRNSQTPIDGTLIGNPDIMPQSYMSQFISKATWTASQLSFNQTTGKTATYPMEGGEARVLLASDGYYVKGIYPEQYGLEEAWVFMKASQDGTQATIDSEQYLGTVSFYADDTRTTTTDVIFSPISVQTDFSGWADNYTSVLFVEDDEQTQTTTIASDGLTTLSLYGYNDSNEFAGTWIHMTDFALTITYELADDEFSNTEVTTSSEGYATFFDSQASYALPSGLVAQTVTGVENGKLTFKTLDGVIPQNTAVILFNENQSSQTFTLKVTETDPYTGANLLYGSDESTWTTGPNNSYFYKLTFGAKGSNLEDLFGWYWGAANGGAFQIEGHKAWLAVPMSAGARYFINNETNGIMAAEKVSTDNDVVFDLQGRRVNTMLNKGLYIKNGKKIVNM